VRLKSLLLPVDFYILAIAQYTMLLFRKSNQNNLKGVRMAGKVYKCLNPVGIQEPVELSPLAPRLDKIDGKRILFSIGAGGEQDILIPLRKRLPEAYPNVNWTIRTAGAHLTKAGSISLTEEEIKTKAYDVLIRGVIW